MTSTVILSDNGASSGSAGLKSTAGNDGVLILQTTTSGGTATNAVYVDNNQNTGFGTSAPDAKITLKNPSVSGEQTVFDVHGATNTTKLLYASVNQTTDVNNFGTGYGGALAFVTNSTERGRWNAGAPILCLSGGNTSATGTGIAFPASQSASSDANTLDDYEEGTFTATLRCSAANPGTKLTTTGYYTKVGRLVTVQFGFESVNTASYSGDTFVDGLPFTPITGVRDVGAAASYGAVTWGGQLVGMISPSSTTFEYLSQASGSGWTPAQISVGTGKYLWGTATYMTT